MYSCPGWPESGVWGSALTTEVAPVSHTSPPVMERKKENRLPFPFAAQAELAAFSCFDVSGLSVARFQRLVLREVFGEGFKTGAQCLQMRSPYRPAFVTYFKEQNAAEIMLGNFWAKAEDALQIPSSSVSGALALGPATTL